jgi:hypothetical protein
MAVTDWRAWTAQNGGSQPGQTSPFPFPGVNPITDLISGANSYPTYADTPTTINAVDPFYVGTVGTGAGWINKMSEYWYDSAGAAHSWPAGSPAHPPVSTGASVPAGPIMRPAIAGLTTP